MGSAFRSKDRSSLLLETGLLTTTLPILLLGEVDGGAHFMERLPAVAQMKHQRCIERVDDCELRVSASKRLAAICSLLRSGDERDVGPMDIGCFVMADRTASAKN